MPRQRNSLTGKRTPVSGKPGVYQRRTANGRVRHDICYRDSSGKQRWKVVDGGASAAWHELQQIQVKMRNGERVVTSRVTFEELAAGWLTDKRDIRAGSWRAYEAYLRNHVVPILGRQRVSAITTDDIADLITALEDKGLCGRTVTNVLVPVSRIFDHAVRRGLTPSNPVKGLERGERPKVIREEMRVLDRHEIDALLQAAPAKYRTLLATALFTGLRASELLGLQWWHIDFAHGVIKVRDQVYRTGERLPLKTDKARRDVILQPALAALLQAHRDTSPHPADGDYVFCRPDGRPMHPDTVRVAGLNKAIKTAGLNPPGKPRLRWHDLRHSYASLLIAQGVDVAYVSRQMGHANVTTTLNTYTHLFDHARNAKAVSERLEQEFGGILNPPTNGKEPTT